jgi:hypothetical protein
VVDPSPPDLTNPEMCWIRRWRGYVTSTFYAVTDDGDVIAESRSFRWWRAAPPAETPQARAAYNELVDALEAEGWTKVASSPTSWFEDRFLRSFSGPGTTAVPSHRAAHQWPRAIPSEPDQPSGPPVPQAPLEHGQQGVAEP